MVANRTLPASLDLEGRRALVTGGSRGIGRAIALLLAQRGADVAVNYGHSKDEAESVCGEIEAAGGKALPVQFDVSDKNHVDAGVKSVADAFGGLEILVNNAGIAIDGLLMRAQESDWERLERVNLRGAILCCQAASRHILKARVKGRVINISSVVGERGNVGQSLYATTKAGLLGLTKSLAQEFAGRGATVNAVTPGFIDTKMTGLESLDEKARQQWLEQIPLKRIGSPEDVAEAVAFLAADAGGYITGHIMRVNGGLP